MGEKLTGEGWGDGPPPLTHERVEDPGGGLACGTCNIVGLGHGDRDWAFHLEWAEGQQNRAPRPVVDWAKVEEIMARRKKV